MKGWSNFVINDRSDGFSLVEVLIAVVVLSAGLLAISTLQIAALRKTQEAYWQSIAILQVTSVLEQIRINHEMVLN